MINSQDIHFFTVIAGAQSLAHAARMLNVTPPAVSQRLQQLEERLNVRLLNRVRGGIQLTAEGEMLALKGREVLAGLVDMEETIRQRQAIVSGPLRVIAPHGFGRKYVGTIMSEFRKTHPEVSLSLTLCDAPYIMARTDSWDVLIHIGLAVDSSLIQSKLAPNRRFLCAAPSYLEKMGCPQSIDDLSQHHCGIIQENEEDVAVWHFRKENSELESVRIAPTFVSNDGETVKRWAIDGHGIIERSEWDIVEELEKGDLVRVLPHIHQNDADIVALVSSRTQRVARTQEFLKQLKQSLTPVPWR